MSCSPWATRSTTPGPSAGPAATPQFQLVDERIVGPKPRTLTFAQAAALPLTSITAWETLFDRFRLGAESSGTLLVLAAAGGVGSMVVQLARALTGLTVIGTASRPESRQWALDLGAHHVVDHHDLVPAVREVAPDGVDYVFSPHTAGMIDAFAEVLHPAGEITAIDEPGGLDLLPLKDKSITFHWELMFTRPLFQTPDMIAQHDLSTGSRNWSTPAPSGPRCPPSSPRSARPRCAGRTPWWKAVT